MSVSGAVARALHLLVTPVFLAMAIVVFHLETAGYGHAGHRAAAAPAAVHAAHDHDHADQGAAHGHAGHTAPAPAAPAAGARIAFGPVAVDVPEPLSRALPSMWLMYLLMALAHAPPWFGPRAGGRP